MTADVMATQFAAIGLLTFFIWTALSVAASYAIGQLTQKNQKIENPLPGNVDLPTTAEGDPFAVVFGMPRRISRTYVSVLMRALIDPVWGTVEYKEWFSTKEENYVKGYKYRTSAYQIVSHGPVDGVKQIWCSDKCAWPNPDDETELGADNTTSITIDEPDFWGGDDSGGGLGGDIVVQYGYQAQTLNQPLTDSYVSDYSSAGRGLVSVTLDNFYMGTSPQIRAFSFLLKRTLLLDDGTDQWYVAKANISNDLNPAHILRESFTCPRWGLGYATSLFDETTWQAFADALYNESLGLSILWNETNKTIEDVITEVLRHIDAVVYQEPSTGYFVPKLIRNDYTAASLESFDDSDVVELSDFKRPSLFEVPNVFTVKYTDIYKDETAAVTEHDIALINAQGGKRIPRQMDYPYATKAAVAARIVARERQEATSMLATMRIRCKRTMSHLRPGDVFKLTWPPLGITNMIVRVMPDARYGTLQDGSVEFQLAEDVFSAGTAIYGIPATAEVSPYNAAAEPDTYLLMETPFYTLAKMSGPSLALALLDDAAFLAVSAKQITEDAINYEDLVREDDETDFRSAGIGAWVATDLILTTMPKNAANAAITLSIDASGMVAGTYAVVGDEVCKVLSGSDGSVTLARGVLDTVPAEHAVNSRIWFADQSQFVAGREFTYLDVAETKLLTRMVDGSQLAEGSATTRTADAFDVRQVRPYPPGNVLFNGQSYPASLAPGALTITWAHRDRTQQTGRIVEHSEVGIGPEIGTTYTIEIYDDQDVLVRTVEDIDGTAWTYTAAMQTADGTDNATVRVKLWSVRSGYTGKSPGGRL